MAALETKVETYEREINRLKRALERSDEYIEDLKRKGMPRNHFDDLRMNEHALRDGTYDSAFTAPSSSSHDIESPLISMQRRIDELATVALATSNSPYSKFNGASSQTMDMNLSGQVQYNVTSSENESESTPETSTPRSIFEDPSKFPACAKLIELTKVRRDLGEQPPSDIVPLDASGRLVDRISNHSRSPKPQDEPDDIKVIKTITSETTESQNLSRVPDSVHDKPSPSSVSASESSFAGSPPSSPCTAMYEVSCSKRDDNCDPGSTPKDSQSDNRHEQQFLRASTQLSPRSYPSSVVLPFDNFTPKRIKIEDQD